MYIWGVGKLYCSQITVKINIPTPDFPLYIDIKSQSSSGTHHLQEIPAEPNSGEMAPAQFPYHMVTTVK